MPPKSTSRRVASTSTGGRGGGRGVVSAAKKGARGTGASSTGPKKNEGWFNPAMDEDIDDDIAFDSDDEKKYGSFFQNQNGQQGGGGKAKAGKADDAFDGFDELSDGGFSDDSRDEVDISELLDSKETRRAAAAERRKKRGDTDADAGDNAAPTEEPAAAKKQAKTTTGKTVVRKGRMMDSAESLLVVPGAEARTGPAPLRQLTEVSASVAAEGSQTAARLAKLQSTQGLIGQELMPTERAKLDRNLARDATAEEMKKWKPFIKEQRTSRTVQFPLKAPDQNPVPATVSGIAHLQRERMAKLQSAVDTSAAAAAAEGDSTAQQPSTITGAATAGLAPQTAAVAFMAKKMDELIGQSGLGTTKAHRAIYQKSKQQQKQQSGQNAEKSAAPTAGDDDDDDDDAQGFMALEREDEGDSADDEGGFGAEGNAGGAASATTTDLGYVAKLKALVGYDAQRRKRFAKIKSKTYRRILRKEREREQELKQRALELVNPDAARKRAQEKVERLRAEERATQRHKNTSKWVKHVKHLAKFDADTKDAIQDQDRLRRQLMAKADEDAEDEIVAAVEEVDSSEDDERRVDELLTGPAAGAQSILWDSARQKPEDAEGLDGAGADEKQRAMAKSLKGVLDMNFMKRARERHQQQFQGELAELQDDIERHQRGLPPRHVDAAAGVDDDDDDVRGGGLDEEERRMRAEDRADGDALDATGLRLKRRATLAAAKEAKKRQEVEEARRVEQVRSTAAGSARKTFAGPTGHTSSSTSSAAANASLAVELPAAEGLVAGSGTARRKQPGEQTSATAKRRSAPVVDAVDDGEGALDGGATEDGIVEEQVAAVTKTAKKKTATKRAAPTATPTDDSEQGLPVSATSTSEHKAPKSGKRVRVEAGNGAAPRVKPSANGETEGDMSHEYLVSRAFARDDIDADFTAAKADQVEAALKPEDQNATLPGWGEWGGDDERLNRRHKSKVEEMSLKRNIERTALAKSRADAHLDHAIINHDVGMIADKHTLHMVPRPYASAAQYARGTRQPLGPEFNSVNTFQQGVTPRVQTKQGVVIDPVDLTTGMHKKAKTRRKKTDAAATIDVSTAEMAGKKTAKQRKQK